MRVVAGRSRGHADTLTHRRGPAGCPGAPAQPQPVTARLLDTAVGAGAEVVADGDADGVWVASAEQFKAADTKLVTCADAELLGLGDAELLGLGDAELLGLGDVNGDGEIVAVGDAEWAAAADDEQDGVGDAEAAPVVDDEADGEDDEPPPAPGLMVQVNDAVAEAPVVSATVKVTWLVPAVVGVPEISPVELIDRPGGRPAMTKASVCPPAESFALSCRRAAVPTVPDWLPGLVIVTVLLMLKLLANPVMPLGVPQPVGPL
jgi:hypothetical protein